VFSEEVGTAEYEKTTVDWFLAAVRCCAAHAITLEENYYGRLNCRCPDTVKRKV